MISTKARTVAKLGLISLGLGLSLAPLLARQAPASDADAHAGHHSAPAAGDAAKGKTVFENASCGTCHALAAAGTVGEIGPSLDHNAKLTHALIVSRVKDGQGAMPPYGGQLSEADIENVAAYILGATAK